MKSLKLLTLTAIALIAIGFSDVKAQETVLIQVFGNNGGYDMQIVDSDNQKIEKKGKGVDTLIDLKKEIDNWITKGYEIISSSVATNSNHRYDVIYILKK